MLKICSQELQTEISFAIKSEHYTIFTVYYKLNKISNVNKKTLNNFDQIYKKHKLVIIYYKN